MDMDAFFAAVEQKRRPELIGKPVVIGGEGDPSRRGVVSTASYEARKYGIRSAMPLRTARKLCPHAVFLPVDYEEYSRVSKRVKVLLREAAPVMEDVGIDEAFLDISSVPKTEEAITREIKDGIRKVSGLTCSIGIAPNRILAKIASDMHKPDGLTIIKEDDIEQVLWPLPVRKLWGIGPKTEEALAALSIRTIGKLAALSLEILTERFGPSYGRFLYDASKGIDESPLVTQWEPKSISRETTFQNDVGNWQTLARTLAELTHDVIAEMRDEGYLARTFTVKVRFDDFETLTRALTLPASTAIESRARQAVFACFKRVKLQKRVRLLGVRAGNLEKTMKKD
jgi:DNA polymerase-4